MKKIGFKSKFTLIFLILLIPLLANSQVIQPVKWTKSIKQIDKNTYRLTFNAKIEKGWHLYGLNIPEGGPIATSFNFEKNDTYSLKGKPESFEEPEVKYDNTFEMNLELFANSATFFQEITLNDKDALVKGYIEFMVCDDSRCLPPTEEEFEFNIDKKSEATNQETKKKSEVKSVTQTVTNLNLTKSDVTSAKDSDSSISSSKENVELTPREHTSGSKTEEVHIESGSGNVIEDDTPLWLLFLKAILGGLAAIITPCVYPIIPLTVSFFASGSTSKFSTYTKALGFGISLIAIYTALGLISGLLQIDLMKAITSHWIPNLIFFLLFVVFAASFFGAFEITLPNKWANSIDQKADKGGMIGAFFMALATAIVSFSCTGPIAGFVLGNAMKGDVVTPVIGMFGFGFGFALPFMVLAFFPQLQKSLPKSGGWLNAVKVVFAFIMLLFSLIFLGLLGENFIPRDFILAAGISILLFLGLYLIGKLKFSHDSDLKYISVPRIILAVISWSLAIYLTTGIFGAPLTKIAPFLPPQHTLGINLSNVSTQQSSKSNAICIENPKYSEKLVLPYGLKGYFDWDEALNCAKELNKPVLVDFVGHYCKNCKKMYAEVWSDSKIQQKLAEEFVILALYTDDRTKLPESEWVTSSLDGRIKKTIGKKNLDFQVTRFNSNALPMYVIVDPEGKILTKSIQFYTYSSSVSDFLDFLNEGLSEFYL